MRYTKSGRYPLPARLLHGVFAVVILWALVTGAMLGPMLPAGPRALLANFNVSLTALLVPLFVVRVAAALAGPRPVPVTDCPLQQRAAAALHIFLYLLTGIALLSGVLMIERDITIFGLFELPRPVTDPVINHRFELVHRQANALLFAAVVGHVAAALRHEHQGRPVLARMFTRMSPAPGVAVKPRRSNFSRRVTGHRGCRG